MACVLYMLANTNAGARKSETSAPTRGCSCSASASAGGTLRGMRSFLSHGRMDTYTVNCSITPISSWLVFLAISYKRGAGGTNIILRASLLQGYIALNFEIYEKAAILMKKSLTLLPGLLLVGLLACLSGCGTNSGTGNVPQGKPDSVSIQIDEVI